MFTVKRPFLRPFIFLVILTAVLLTACTGGAANENWPGLTADENLVYVSYGRGVFAYDVVAQQPMWHFRPENASRLIFAPPSVAADRVIVGDYGSSGGMFSPSSVVSVYGLTVVDNRAVTPTWTNDKLAKDRIVAAPLQVDDRVYVATADNFVLALDADTGAELWRFPTGFSIWAQPTYYEGTLFVTSLDRNLYALDADSGTEKWRADLGGAAAAKPVVDPDTGLVYAASFDKQLHAFDLSTGQEAWVTNASDWIWSAPALANGTLYFGDSSGNVYAVDAANGAILWQTAVHEADEVQGVTQGAPAAIKGAIQASPVIFENTLYVASEGNQETGEGLLVALDAETGLEKWQRTTPAPLFSTPVIADGAVIVGLTSETAVIMAFDLTSGNPKWSYLPPS